MKLICDRHFSNICLLFFYSERINRPLPYASNYSDSFVCTAEIEKATIWMYFEFFTRFILKVHYKIIKEAFLLLEIRTPKDIIFSQQCLFVCIVCALNQVKRKLFLNTASVNQRILFDVLHIARYLPPGKTAWIAFQSALIFMPIKRMSIVKNLN